MTKKSLGRTSHQEGLVEAWRTNKGRGSIIAATGYG